MEAVRVMSLGQRLKQLRDDQRLTQLDISLRTGNRVTPATISRIETGEVQEPQKITLQLLAEALGVSVSYLIGDDDDLREVPTRYITEGEMMEQLARQHNLDPEDLRAWIEALEAMPAEVREYELQGAKLRARGLSKQRRRAINEPRTEYDATPEVMEG